LIRNKKSYPTLWIIDGLEHAKDKISNMCICGYSRHLAFLDDDPLQPLMVSDILIVDGECSDSEWCLDTECKYNKTTSESFTKHHHFPQKEAEKTIKGWDNLIQTIKKINQTLPKYKELMNFKRSEIKQSTTPMFWYEK
jgi:hypothetical protein